GDADAADTRGEHGGEQTRRRREETADHAVIVSRAADVHSRHMVRGYLLSRLLQTALVVFLSLTAVFAMVRLSGDPVTLFMPMDIQAKDINEFRERLGFNDPLGVQYARFIGGARRGGFGQ